MNIVSVPSVFHFDVFILKNIMNKHVRKQNYYSSNSNR